MVHHPFSSVLIGEGPLLLACADFLIQRGHRICAIVCADAVVQRFASERGVICLDPGSELGRELDGVDFEYLFSIGNLQWIRPDLLRLARRGGINFHDSLLPDYAGLHATSWALIDRATSHGVTWHTMTERIDSGDVLKQHPVALAPDDTAYSLNKKCVEAGIESFQALVEELEQGKAVAVPQALSGRRYFSRFTRPADAGILSWNRSAHELNALVRALDFGPAPNPLGCAKAKLGSDYYVVRKLEILPERFGARPGTIAGIDPNGIVVTTSDFDVRLSCLHGLEGDEVDWAKLAEVCPVGTELAGAAPELAREIERQISRMAQQERFWLRRLAALRPLQIDFLERRADGEKQDYASLEVPLSARVIRHLESVDVQVRELWLMAGFAGFISRLTDETEFDIGFADEVIEQQTTGLDSLAAGVVPFRIHVPFNATIHDLSRTLGEERERLNRHGSYWRDLYVRYSELNATRHTRKKQRLPIAIRCNGGGDAAGWGVKWIVQFSAGARGVRWVYDRNHLRAGTVTRLAEHWAGFLDALTTLPGGKISDVPLLSENEVQQLLSQGAGTERGGKFEPAGESSMEQEALRNPDRIAIVCGDEQITYGELNARANQLAHHLRARGIGPGVLACICMERSIEMVVALFAVFKAGGAYVPLDPNYPKERLQWMLADSAAPVLLTQERLVQQLPEHGATVVRVDADWPVIARESNDPPNVQVQDSDLAYVMYTSGSTGKPKGVMVEHRNVMNFFAGMDDAIGAEPAGTWLAVTSISFDISVLELFWTLARGYKVILHSEQRSSSGVAAGARNRSKRQIGFSLFYFASDEGGGHADKYRLLLEGARFADAHGFEAVWTPERHFHAFGGLYPNPAVTSAALAAITQRVQIRAGSVVVPLHHPIRVAEEWAVVDNISKGRVGISVASGWQANDFVLAPDQYRNSKEIMFRNLDIVRKLWRGEPVTYPNGKGEEVPVKILPRPIQQELPIWVTAAGNPDTFRAAGEIGANLLTHLLGQNLQALEEKIALYREAWHRVGHSGEGKVTLMLHTFVGESMETVREAVRKPFSDYLRSSVDLIKNAPSAFPTFSTKLGGSKALDEAMRSGKLSAEDMDALVAHAFDRYFETSALFGTPDTCMEMVERLIGIGVDEVACLIDFGVEPGLVLESLQHLDRVRARAAEIGSTTDSIPELMLRHNVTHLQCTPSLARMLLAQERGAEAFGRLQKLFVGGEALPQALAEQLVETVPGQVFNMYGPTETTVWSAVAKITKPVARVHIGRPIANTQVYILDPRMRPVPVGITGELFIGGLGVTRGYWNRPDLTAERFIPDPFQADGGGRLYRTGDAVRYLEDGNIEFLGRLDNQVKIRGHRIELQEIEQALGGHPEVREAVVVAREETPGNSRLVAYLVGAKDRTIPVAALRNYLLQKLPDFMVPEIFVFMEAMPLTPNGKVNRRALPAPDGLRPELGQGYVAPRTPTEEELARVWQKELGLEQAGVEDNFFDLGGNSLLAVQIAFRVRQVFQVELPLQMFFERPTISKLAMAIDEQLMQKIDEAKLAELLAEIEAMPEDEGGATESSDNARSQHALS